MRAYRDLVTSIKAIGLQHPISVLADGRTVLDGKNRLNACEELSITPTTRVVDIGDVEPARWVLELNRHRLRTNGQLALAAARLADMPRGNPKLNPNTTIVGISVEDAARLCGVNKKAVERAKVIIEHAVSELIAFVELGELSIHPACLVAELPKKKQLEAAAIDASAVRKLAAEIRASRKPGLLRGPDHVMDDARRFIGEALRAVDDTEREQMRQLLHDYIDSTAREELLA